MCVFSLILQYVLYTFIIILSVAHHPPHPHPSPELPSDTSNIV